MVVQRMRTLERTGNATFDRAVQNTAHMISKKPPCKEWLLALIATMDPGAEIFNKSYVKPKVPRY